MASTSCITLTPPVRVLLRVATDQLDHLTDSSCEPGVDQADTKLIQIVSSHICNCDSAKVRHLVTRIAKRVWIVFDYDVPKDDRGPRVAAFDVNLEHETEIIPTGSGFELLIRKTDLAWPSAAEIWKRDKIAAEEKVEYIFADQKITGGLKTRLERLSEAPSWPCKSSMYGERSLVI
jgi:hypothetical protein